MAWVWPPISIETWTIRFAPLLALGLTACSAEGPTPSDPGAAQSGPPPCPAAPEDMDQAFAAIETMTHGQTWSNDRCDLGFPALQHAYGGQLATCWGGSPLYSAMFDKGVNGHVSMTGVVFFAYWRKKNGYAHDLDAVLAARAAYEREMTACSSTMKPESFPDPAIGVACIKASQKKLAGEGWPPPECGVHPQGY